MGDAELAALREVLASGWITTGPKNQALEAAFCQLTDNRHAIAVSSATGGMHVTLMALGIVAPAMKSLRRPRHGSPLSI